MEQPIKPFDSLAELLEDLDQRNIQGQKRKRIVYAYLGYQARLKDRPIVGSFELTPLCNFDCKMCYVHLKREQMGGRPLLTTDQWKQIIDMAAAAGIMGADLTGGECLTHPGFKEIFLHLLRRGIQPSVLTNGSLLTQEMVDFFVCHPPRTIQITLYGSDRESYIKVTGQDAFDDVIAGIQRLKAANLPFSLVITPSRHMQENADALLDYLRSLKIPYGIGGISLPARPETERKLEDYCIDDQHFAAIQKNEVQYLSSLSSSLSQPDYYMLPLKRPSYHDGAPCGAAHNAFHVNWKGEMTPCISFYSVTSSMLKNGFEKAWTEIREKMKAYHYPTECQSCDLRQHCESCPAEKCMGTPGAPLNRGVCSRMRAYAENGLLGIIKINDCQWEGDEIHEENLH